jgi:hypothetical protein
MRRDDGSDIDIAFHEARLTLRDGTPVLIRQLVTEDALSRFSKPRDSRGSLAALLRNHARGEPRAPRQARPLRSGLCQGLLSADLVCSTIPIDLLGPVEC